MSTATPLVRRRVTFAYAGFVTVGLSAGVSGVLLPSQMADYGVSKQTIGLTFFSFGLGFLLSGFSSGWVLHRMGFRAALALGGGASVVAAVATGLRPPFLLLVALGVVGGYGAGMVESILNAYLIELPDAAALLNRLHAFFGVGALLGPLLAALMLRDHAWTSVWLVLAVVWAVTTWAFVVVFPGGAVTSAHDDGSAGGGRLAEALRSPAVVLAAIFLAIYVGLEISLGNWGYSYLTADRHEAHLAAGWTMSGFWLGLTLGRFTIGPYARRRSISVTAVNYGCLLAILCLCLLAWGVPWLPVVVASVALMGFWLGPIFPMAIAAVPGFTSPRLVPTAIGVMNGVGILGGAVLPWFAGVLADAQAIWTLLPYSAFLCLVLLGVWWRLDRRTAHSPQQANAALQPQSP